MKRCLILWSLIDIWVNPLNKDLIIINKIIGLEQEPLCFYLVCNRWLNEWLTCFMFASPWRRLRFLFSSSMILVVRFLACNFVSQHTLLLSADERGVVATEEGCGTRRNWLQLEMPRPHGFGWRLPTSQIAAENERVGCQKPTVASGEANR